MAPGKTVLGLARYGGDRDQVQRCSPLSVMDPEPCFGRRNVRKKVLAGRNHIRAAPPCGENMVVGRDNAMLGEPGGEVETDIRNSDATQPVGPVERPRPAEWKVCSQRNVKACRAQVRSFRRDLVSVRNAYPLISPASIPTAKGAANTYRRSRAFDSGTSK